MILWNNVEIISYMGFTDASMHLLIPTWLFDFIFDVTPSSSSISIHSQIPQLVMWVSYYAEPLWLLQEYCWGYSEGEGTLMLVHAQ